MIDFATCAELYIVHRQACAARSDSDPGGCRGLPEGLGRRGDADDPAEAHVPLPHGSAGQRRRTSSRPSTGTPTRSCDSDGTPYMHEIVGADAVMNGKAETVAGVKALGPYALRIRTTRPLPDLISRLTMPFFCPVAVGTPARGDRPTSSARGRTTSPRASRTASSCSSGTATTAGHGPRTSTGSSGRSDRARRHVAQAVERDAARLVRVPLRRPRTDSIASTYGINEPERAVLFQSDTRDRILRLQPRSTGVQGAGPDPAHARRSTGRSTGPRSCEHPASSEGSAPTRSCRPR